MLCVLLVLFLRTQLGLSLRATGDNRDMVSASSINPAFTTTVGLCLSNAVVALSGALIAQYQKFADNTLGTGMVVIGLASLIIGETIFGRKTIPWRALGVVVGSCLYRVIVAIALRFDLPASALKLVSAIIVAVAISYPTLMRMLDFQQRKLARRGKDLNRILLVVFAALTVLLAAAGLLLPQGRALLLMLAALAVIGTIWAALRLRKKGGAVKC